VLFKHRYNLGAMGQTDSAAKSGIGAPEADEIVTTRQALVVSTPQAVGACFDDWRVSGLKPPGTIVSRLKYLSAYLVMRFGLIKSLGVSHAK
jgi:hypothetical protein